MRINICSRLVDKMIKNGHQFVHGYKYPTITTDIPLGIYSEKSYKIGEIVRTMSGKMSNIPTQISIHIGDNMHLEDEIGQYINHSFDPNIRVESNKLIAIKDINIYDEITFNYNDTEVEMACPFEDDGILVCGKKK